MFNIDIRNRIAVAAIPKWRVADVVGVADTTFSKWLRKELPAEKKQQVMEAIDKILAERGSL